MRMFWSRLARCKVSIPNGSIKIFNAEQAQIAYDVSIPNGSIKIDMDGVLTDFISGFNSKWFD